MAEVSSHPQGMPSWAELSTTDEAGAVRFYGALFGWTDDPMPMGEGQTYHMFKLRGLEVAGMAKQSDQERGQGVPPHWNTYFAVTSADEAARRARDAGGAVIFGPTDVFEAGRLAFIQDPQGGVFGIWQARQHVGYRVVDEPGARTWNELMTTDPSGAERFYCTVLATSSQAMPEMNYTMLMADGRQAAGIMQMPAEMGQHPPYWSVYFAVADVDASAGKAVSLGAKLTVPGTDIPGVGRFAVLQDPQGAFFCLFQAASPPA